MPPRRYLSAVLLALLSLLAAGCGSKSSTPSTGGGSTPAGASMVRAGVARLRVGRQRSLGSSQWQQLADKLAQKFPGRDQAVAMLNQELAKQGVDYQRDVKPAVGPEVDLAVVLAGTPASSTKEVLLTKPEDAGKFKALVTKLNAKQLVGQAGRLPRGRRLVRGLGQPGRDHRGVEGHRLLTRGRQRVFKAAIGKLPGDALVKAFVDGQRINALVTQARIGERHRLRLVVARP